MIEGRRESGLMWGGRRFAVQQLLHHELGVANAAGQLLTAAELLQQRQLVGAEVSLLIDVGHCAHQRTQDQLGVVLAERKTCVQCLRHGKKCYTVQDHLKRLVGEGAVHLVSNLEEVDLNGAVGEVQDDGALGSEPEGEVRQSCQLVSFPTCDVGAGLQKVLAHVVAEILQQGYLHGEKRTST